MKRVLIALLVLMSVMSLAAAQVNNDCNDEYTYTEVWDGRGGIDEEPQCDKLGESPERTEDGWIHWVFSTKGASTDAYLVLTDMEGESIGTYNPAGPLDAEVWHFYTEYTDVNDLKATIYLNGAQGPGSGLVISDYCPGDNGDGGTGGDDDPEPIPEFPTVALPIAAILGLAFFFQRRKE